jgi:hypothetical protein
MVGLTAFIVGLAAPIVDIDIQNFTASHASAQYMEAEVGANPPEGEIHC